MKTNVLIIRFHYAAGDPRFPWRFDYFKAMVLPRILMQTDKNFDIAIWCNPAHDYLFTALSEKIKVFHAKKETVEYKIKSGKKYYYDFIQYEDLEGLPKYDIQTGIDSDDLMGPDYIKVVNMQMESARVATHLSFQPRTFNLKNLQIKPMMTYGEKRGSAFMALYQPDKTKYKFLYCASHIGLWRQAERSIILPAGHCWATIHWLNESTGK
jgi:hypothetical protein